MARLGTTKKVTLVFERFAEDHNNGSKQMRHLIILRRKLLVLRQTLKPKDSNQSLPESQRQIANLPSLDDNHAIGAAPHLCKMAVRRLRA
eukprot:scaffold581877_cov19-Prasinocladus_malaysianus.AAC.1